MPRDAIATLWARTRRRLGVPVMLAELALHGVRQTGPPGGGGEDCLGYFLQEIEEEFEALQARLMEPAPVGAEG